MGVLTQKRAVLFVAAVLLCSNAFGSNPSPRSGARLAWDTPNNVGVLFGGIGPTDRGATEIQHDSAETWLWNGTRWLQRFPETAPPPRSLHSMTYDTTRHRVVMFGGRVAPADKKLDPTYRNDTWVYSNDNWTHIESAENPAARQHTAMAYDRVRDRVVLYGGNILNVAEEKFDLFSDTWEFDGTQWQQVIGGTTGPKVAKPLMEYDASRNQMILIGLNETGTEKIMYRYNA
ncbi:MAG TPA: kelch repeat-containing protein, partial [Thermoanaerobaculia bacterium]|nr:kelch repeat-containing protein [Thermoanaerobaculia bacterium]